MANDILSNQIAASEFNTAKNIMITVDSEIDKLIFKVGASSAIKTSFFNTAPGFTRKGQNMNITFEGRPPYTVGVNSFNIEARPGIGGIFDYDIKGDGALLNPTYNGSFGRVHVSKPMNWRVSLDYERAFYVSTGVSSIFNGTHYVYMNNVDVTALYLEFGEFQVETNSMILIKNDHVDTSTFTLTGNWSLTVSSRGRSSPTVRLSEMGGNPSYNTIVTFYKVYMIIDVMGAG